GSEANGDAASHSAGWIDCEPDANGGCGGETRHRRKGGCALHAEAVSVSHGWATHLRPVHLCDSLTSDPARPPWHHTARSVLERAEVRRRRARSRFRWKATLSTIAVLERDQPVTWNSIGLPRAAEPPPLCS